MLISTLSSKESLRLMLKIIQNKACFRSLTSFDDLDGFTSVRGYWCYWLNKGQVVLILYGLEIPELTEDDIPVIEL